MKTAIPIILEQSSHLIKWHTLNDIFVYDTQRNNYQDGIAVKKSINETRNLQTLGNQKFSAVTKQLDIITGNESFEDLMKSYCEAK